MFKKKRGTGECPRTSGKAKEHPFLERGRTNGRAGEGLKPQRGRVKKYVEDNVGKESTRGGTRGAWGSIKKKRDRAMRGRPLGEERRSLHGRTFARETRQYQVAIQGHDQRRPNLQSEGNKGGRGSHTKDKKPAQKFGVRR